jgi:hypothetical protein
MQIDYIRKTKECSSVALFSDPLQFSTPKIRATATHHVMIKGATQITLKRTARPWFKEEKKVIYE